MQHRIPAKYRAMITCLAVMIALGTLMIRQIEHRAFEQAQARIYAQIWVEHPPARMWD